MVRLFRQLQLIRLFKQLEVRQRLKRALQADPLVPEAAAAGSAESLAAVEAQVMAKYTAGQSRVGQRLSGEDKRHQLKYSAQAPYQQRRICGPTGALGCLLRNAARSATFIQPQQLGSRQQGLLDPPSPAPTTVCAPCCSDLTMKRVISGVLAMLIVLPALEISSGINGRDTPLALGGLQMLHEQALTAGSSSQAFNSSLKVGAEGQGRARRRCMQLHRWLSVCIAGCSSSNQRGKARMPGRLQHQLLVAGLWLSAANCEQNHACCLQACD